MCTINNREQLTGSFLIKLYDQYSWGRAIIAAIQQIEKSQNKVYKNNAYFCLKRAGDYPLNLKRTDASRVPSV